MVRKIDRMLCAARAVTGFPSAPSPLALPLSVIGEGGGSTNISTEKFASVDKQEALVAKLLL